MTPPVVPARPSAPSSRPGKALTWVLIALGVCGVIAVVGSQATKRQQEALAEGDKLYATKPAEAVARYKDGYPAAGDRKAEVLQRIVDHEAEAGNTAEAARWVEKGLDDKVAVEYKSAAARGLLAKAERDRADRAAAKQAEKDAKAAQQTADRSARDQVKANRSLPREQFRALLAGKTKDQVREAVGKPDQTQDVEGVGEMWYYSGVATDPTTNKKSVQVQVVFERGVVSSVNFN